MIKNRFADNLKHLRNKNGMTQEMVAEKIFATRQTISVFERNGGKPNIDHILGLCEVFKVEPTELLLGYPLGVKEEADKMNNDEIRTERSSEDIDDYEYYDSSLDVSNMIRNIRHSGFYTIIDEDLQNFFGLIAVREPEIFTIISVLGKEGYKIVDVFSNGFSIFLRSIDEAESFKRDLYNIFEGFIHGDEDVTKLRYSYRERINERVLELEAELEKEIFGDYIENFSYYWVDENENTRGYGKTEEDCNKEASIENCNKYQIIKNN